MKASFELTFFALCVAIFFTGDANELQSKADECLIPSRSISRFTIKHRESGGIGYKKGYSTLEAFLGGYGDQCLIFLDGRGHVFDNGFLASNAGVGFRGITSSNAIFGANVYYDYRQDSHSHFHQLGGGVEVLWKYWTGRVNGYFPFGQRNFFIESFGFAGFQGHEAYLRNKYRFSFRGLDGEISYKFWENNWASLDAVLGGYCLWGKFNEKAPGGLFRFTANLGRYVSLEGQLSCDPVFKWKEQGAIAINIPIGRSIDIKRKWSECSCKKICQERMVEPVSRFEIIPIESKTVKQPFIDPATNEPYYFVFVDNVLGSSDGSYEHPYPTLVEAQDHSSPRNIVYVFPGDNTFRGMDAGIVLKDFQQLLGAGYSHDLNTTKGVQQIPAQAVGSPLITNLTPMALSAVSLASYNTVSGIYAQMPADMVFGETAVIVGSHIDSAIITRSTIDGAAFGIVVTECDGTIKLDHNLFINASTYSFYSQFDTGLSGLSMKPVVTNNTIQQANGANGIVLFPGGTQHYDVVIQNNSLSAAPELGSLGIQFLTFGSSSIDYDISNNLMESQSIGIQLGYRINNVLFGNITNNHFVAFNGETGNQQIIFQKFGAASSANIIQANIANNQIENGDDPINFSSNYADEFIFHIKGNVFMNSGSSNIRASSVRTSMICLSLDNNVFDKDVILDQSNTSLFKLETPSGNTGLNIVSSGTITSVPPGTCE